MSNKQNIQPFQRQGSEGLGWADQWGYNDANDPPPPSTKKEKLQAFGGKAKSATKTGLAKAKVGASYAGQKMSAGFGWMKEQVAKRRAPK